MNFSRVLRASARHLLVGLVAASAACGGGFERFPNEAPMERDGEDFRTYLPAPEAYISPFAWDGSDQMLFRPMARFFAVDPAGEAINVNALDEVPDSSWFENRTSVRPRTLAEVEAGPCTGPPLDPNGPWFITDAKPNGANPGFIMKDASGRRFLLKFDSTLQPERATAADVLGTRIYHAAGFHTPCNRIVFFDRSVLRIDEGATYESGGEERPMTWEYLEPIFAKAYVRRDGLMRAASSQFLPGRPLGPFRYEGTRDDDPNDVVPHEDRRELRGAIILAAWINHFDSREQNTLTMWIADEDDAPGYVHHHIIDFGDSFGSLWAWDSISRRFGHAAYFDLRTLFADFATLGVIRRPWEDAEFGPAGQVLGYFTTEHLDPVDYEPGYPNPAFLRASDRDQAWMARILADITPPMIDVIVDGGEFENVDADRQLRDVLRGRRMALLNHWLRVRSPLARPVIEVGDAGARLCMRDLAVSSGVVPEWEARPYWSTAYRHEGGDRLEPLETGAMARRPPDVVCVGLPAAGGTPEQPAYLIVDVGARELDRDAATIARVHLYELSAGQYRIVGLERPGDLSPPGE
ncbi:MAG: hypothetical protein AAF645_06830 [Myxococcota bacterium]